MRSASVFFTVILHASLLQKSSATTLYVHEHFNEEISPCTDFNKHVCNLPSAHNPFFKQTHANVLFEEAYENTLKSIADPIYDEIAKIISAKEALVIDHCRKDYTYNPKASDAHAQGMAFGKRIAFGTAKDCSIHCHERKYCMLRLPDDRVFQKEPFSQAPPFIQGVFKGFFRLIDPKFKTKDLEVEYSITANSKFSASDVGEFEAFKKIDTSKDFRKSLLKVLFSSDRFAAYFNYLYSLRLLQAEVFPESEVVKELDTLYQLILTETIATVSNSYTVETRNREDLVGHLRKIENVIGVPEIYRNIEVLKKKVEYFQEQFALFKHVFEKSDCKLQLASGWLYLFHLQELLKENRLSTENVKTESVFQWNLFYDPGHDHPAIRMLPAFIHIAKQEMSIGMKYGILASSIGHEIFHALGLGEDYHLIRVQQNEYYKDNKKCYEDYYGSFRVNIDGKMKYPNGELKAEEGFCDIEGSRVAVRVLKKVLESRNLSRESRSISGRVKYPTFDSVPLQLLIDNKKLIDPYAMNLTEIQWFYVFSALIHCSNLADDAAFKNYRGDEHPRPTQRANALVGQLREFTKAFQCRPDDRLFVTPRRCEMFPQKIEGKPKPKISAWKTNPSMAATVDARKRKKSAKKTWSISNSQNAPVKKSAERSGSAKPNVPKSLRSSAKPLVKPATPAKPISRPSKKTSMKKLPAKEENARKPRKPAKSQSKTVVAEMKVQKILQKPMSKSRESPDQDGEEFEEISTSGTQLDDDSSLKHIFIGSTDFNSSSLSSPPNSDQPSVNSGLVTDAQIKEIWNPDRSYNLSTAKIPTINAPTRYSRLKFVDTLMIYQSRVYTQQCHKRVMRSRHDGWRRHGAMKKIHELGGWVFEHGPNAPSLTRCDASSNGRKFSYVKPGTKLTIPPPTHPPILDEMELLRRPITTAGSSKRRSRRLRRDRSNPRDDVADDTRSPRIDEDGK